VLRASAKVNLALEVLGKRGDGYHEIATVLQAVDLFDRLTVETADTLLLHADDPELPTDEGNLVMRAARLLQKTAGIEKGARIELQKRIPVAAGLGGGSADAAAALRAANRLAGEPLDAPALRALAVGLGADVPSQVEPRHALVQGIGERIEPVGLPPLWAVVVAPKTGLATKDVYAELDRRGGWRERLDPAPLFELAGEPAAAIASALENDLHAAAVALRPELSETLDRLRSAGAPAAAVSGSGPTCFALFPDRAAAERAAAATPGAISTALRGEPGA
jgi:4-diphosphocytidyl-2-C-methyl-D-erythritol kinase